MQLYHNSYLPEFRSPFGAVPTESTISLSLEIKTDIILHSVFLRLWNGNENLIEMTCKSSDADTYFYNAEITVPKTACLLWYYFIVHSNEGTFYYSNNERRLGGEGIMTASPTDISYQITVYDKNFKTPDWFKNSIMYQIFPDRFFSAKTENVPLNKKTQYTLHGDWYEPLSFDRHPFEDGPACNDFYGGNFKGIQAKLPYLKALGVSVIYLNPIFEAFSNHRYDTADYSHTDPILGTEEEFSELCRECEKNDIKIILDGVFSHTGSDSIYFNKYKSYGENVGAYQNPDSPFRKWYQWTDNGCGYESWWGCSNLPNIFETEPTYIDYILSGEHSIIKEWIRKGASGWRLDVADELPDEFIKNLRTAVKSVDSEAVVIGEVWEDASNKVSYGCRREYLWGDELDSVMNYPFKDNVIGFILGYISAEDFGHSIMSIAENYPKESLYAAMNIIGTHDTMRIKTVFGEQKPPDNADVFYKQNMHLSYADETRALKRVRLAAFMQMTFVGVPCIYYGDEIGMQGLGDPFNRMPFSWRCMDTELLEHYQALTSLRNSMPCLRTGDFRQAYAKDGVFAYLRTIENNTDALGNPAKNQAALCIVNRNEHEYTAEIPLEALCGYDFENIYTGEKLFLNGKNYKINLSGYDFLIFGTQ